MEAEEVPEAEIDMTPMIDVTFLLIIFFMVVSDMSQLDLAELTLPFASKAHTGKITDPAENPSLCINVQEDGTILIKGVSYKAKEGKGTGKQLLSNFLKIEAEASPRENPPAENPGLRPSKLRVLIRADRYTRFEYVQYVFDACQKNTIYKTVLGASKEDR